MNQYIPKVEGHVLVLGGSGGIGSEVARAMVALGASAVTFTYGKKREVAEALKQEFESQGIKVHFASINRSDEGAFKAFLQEAITLQGGEVTAMVDAIGISPNTHHLEQTMDEWRNVMQVNVIDAFVSTRAVLERMREKEVKGSVVLITSTNGVNSWASYSMHYDASKAALVPMLRGFAEEYAKYGIRINGLAPGWIDTEMNVTLPPGEKEKETAKIWLGRFATPAEVASMAAILSSSSASYITGQNIMIDGGYR